MKRAIEVVDIFSLARHDGPYKSWPHVSELLRENQKTGKSIPGYSLDAQFSYLDNYLCITSWECGEDSLEIVLLDRDLNVLDRKTLGAMYSNFVFDSAQTVGLNQAIVCATESPDPDKMTFRITVGDSLNIELYSDLQATFLPYPRTQDELKSSSSRFQVLTLVALLGIVMVITILAWIRR